MQDPHLDIAMFGIYSLYNEDEMNKLIDIYFDGKYDLKDRAKIYSYIAISGLLWSNWCEYKRELGVDFGEYSLRQYRYAKDYYRKAKLLMEKLTMSKVKRAIIMAAWLWYKVKTNNLIYGLNH